MKAIILAGGRGTRLRPLTCRIPKPMLPVMNIPVIEHTLMLLKNHNIKDIGITTMYMPKIIENYLKDGSKWNVNLTYFTEEHPLGTAGSLLNASSFLTMGCKKSSGSIRPTIHEPFLVICGDCITDLDLTGAINFHLEKRSIVTIVLTQVKNPQQYGIALTDSNGCITKFLEKPKKNEIFSNMINTGIYIMEPEVLNYIKPCGLFDFSRDLFPALLKEKLPVYGYSAPCYWSDIGVPEAYLKTHWDILNKKLETYLNNQHHERNICTGKSTVIEPTAVINGPCVIGNNCYIGHGALIDKYSVIGNNCIINKRAVIKRSLLFNNCIIGKGSMLVDSILGAHVHLMDDVRLSGNVVGDESIVHEKSIIV